MAAKAQSHPILRELFSRHKESDDKEASSQFGHDRNRPVRVDVRAFIHKVRDSLGGIEDDDVVHREFQGYHVPCNRPAFSIFNGKKCRRPTDRTSWTIRRKLSIVGWPVCLKYSQ